MRVLYICDRKKCHKCYEYCSLTEDIRYAKNFEQDPLGDFVEKSVANAEDVAPVVHAEWMKKKSMMYCSNCASGWETGYIKDFNYCPNCGAKMDKEANNE